MIYIIEGSNKVGKTTGLAFRKSNNEIVINNRYINNLMEDRKNESFISALSMLEFMVALNNIKFNVFIDRYHLSEIVYGKMFRNYTNDNMYALDRELQSIFGNDIALVLVKSDYHHITNDEKNDLIKIQEKFMEEFAKSNISKKYIIDSNDFVKGVFYEKCTNSIDN